ncbi:2E4.130, partial [Symbiodinium sp. CCMP2456]
EADLEAELEAQPDGIASLEALMGVLVYGTFRCVSGISDGQQKRCGEVLIERGPECLHRCKVHILVGKNRGQAWDFDRCHVRILYARVFSQDGSVRRRPLDSTGALDLGRTELFGRILLSKEFGVTRQKLYVCSKSKVVRSKKVLSFHPINGKLPGISVPWDEALSLPSNHDLHVVEVTDWSRDLLRPRGRYIQ